MPSEIKDLSKLCVHTMTNKPWSLDECIKAYSKAAIGGISVWRNVLENIDTEKAGQRIKDAGLTPVSLVRGGFFTGETDTQRAKAIDDNKRAIEEAAQIGTDLVVLVCGATPGFTVKENIAVIREGIEKVIPFAEQHKVRLGIEPLHPMYADTRSAVSSLKSANDLAEKINSPVVGVTIDVFHVFWEEYLEEEINRCADINKLFSFHICDWKTDMADMLTDRGLMGDGIINIKQIRGWVEDSGFKGFNEVEVFSDIYWSMDQEEYLSLIIERYLGLTE